MLKSDLTTPSPTEDGAPDAIDQPEALTAMAISLRRLVRPCSERTSLRREVFVRVFAALRVDLGIALAAVAISLLIGPTHRTPE